MHVAPDPSTPPPPPTTAGSSSATGAIVGAIVGIVVVGALLVVAKMYFKSKADGAGAAQVRPAMMSPSSAAYVTENDEASTTAGKPKPGRKLSFAVDLER